ncbi:MAG: hypothetical protein F4Y45_07360 [Acidobacteria bacterium]|nr:hypothetical protein [Acidobacteriota bacterium]MXZ70415.1 hypothetical protein [Acidobacteriota bacterium]MYD70783.1 hypothetical protein [Acidobacteriota bacterium]
MPGCSAHGSQAGRAAGPWGLRGLALAALTVLTAVTAAGQPAGRGDGSPFTGNWRGTATGADGATTEVVLALTDADGAWAGTVSGFEPGRDAPLTRIEIGDASVVAEAEVVTRLGALILRYDLTLADDGRQLTGTQQVIAGAARTAADVELRLWRRSDVPQPQVEQRIGYFTGTWRFDYLGGEYPPLSIGTRSGQVVFTPRGEAPWVDGAVTGEVFGEAYEERLSIGFDPESQTLVQQEQLSNGIELLSVGDWRSPIGIEFVTRPVEADGRTYQMRRQVTFTSERAFRVTEEFSIDGGPFRRLGNADYQRID